MATNSSRNIMLFVLIIIIGVIAWFVMTMPDQRTAGQKLGDAVDALPQGVGKAAEQLQDRTPGEKIGDAVKDVGQDIKDSTNR